VQDLALFSPEPLPELNLRPWPIHRFLFVESPGDSPGAEPPNYFGDSLTFDEWWDVSPGTTGNSCMCSWRRDTGRRA